MKKVVANTEEVAPTAPTEANTTETPKKPAFKPIMKKVVTAPTPNTNSENQSEG